MNKMKIKPIPNPAIYDTLAPDMDYIYFKDWKSHPFEPRAEKYSPVNAWWLADAAFLSYCHPGFVRMAFKLAGFPDFSFFNGPGTECMVAVSKAAVIVAFRGTEINSRSVFHEVGTDLNTRPVPFPEGGTVHQGFLLALEEVWEEKGEDYRQKNPKHNSGLSRCLNKLKEESPDRPMWICGHSLGGALASLCFARLPEAHGLYIYGAPRVGDAEFISLLGNRPVFRIEHARDPVPLVPPEIPSLNFHFRDGGTLIYINRNGKILDEKKNLEHWSGRKTKELITEEENRREIAIEKAWKHFPKDVKSLEKNLIQINKHVKQSFNDWTSYIEEIHDEFAPRVEDHMPIYYAVKLWNLLVKEKD